MKIILMRHGHAEPFHPDGDRSRSLSQKGRDQSLRSAYELLEEKTEWSPDFVFCSSAVRAHETWKIVSPILGLIDRHRYQDQFLNATVDDMLDLMMSLSDEMACVMFVGHNPVWEDMYARLCQHRVQLNPAEILCLRSDDDDWLSAAQSNSWNLVRHIRPTQG